MLTIKNCRKTAQNIYKDCLDKDLFSFTIDNVKKLNAKIQKIATEFNNNDLVRHISQAEKEELENSIVILNSLNFENEYSYAAGMLKFNAKIIADRMLDAAKWYD